MTQEELKDIEQIIESKIKEIAGNLGYGYLDCKSKQWKDYKDNVCIISEMEIIYLKRCLITVDKSNKFKSIDFKYVNKAIAIDASNLTEDDKEEIINVAKLYLHKLHDEKIKEIESELASR